MKVGVAENLRRLTTSAHSFALSAAQDGFQDGFERLKNAFQAHAAKIQPSKAKDCAEVGASNWDDVLRGRQLLL